MNESFQDRIGSIGLFGNELKIANELRERMKYELGLTISVNVSFCKVFVKLGSDLKSPGAVTVISKDSFREQIWDLPTSDMVGVGRSTSKLLASYDIRTIGQIANAHPDLIERKLCENGILLFAFAKGLDFSKEVSQDYEPPMKSVWHGITTIEDLKNNAEVPPDAVSQFYQVLYSCP